MRINTTTSRTFTLRASFIAIAVFICLMSTGHVFAQTNEFKRVEISAGYSFTRPPLQGEAPRVPNGGTAGFGVKIKKWIAIYGEAGYDWQIEHFGGSVQTVRNHSRTSIVGGVRVYLNNKTHFTPFINGGVGYVRYWNRETNNGTPALSYGLTNALFAAGGGVDIAINKKGTWNWRNSAEFRRVEVGLDGKGAPNNGAAFRYMTGIVFKF